MAERRDEESMSTDGEEDERKCLDEDKLLGEGSGNDDVGDEEMLLGSKEKLLPRSKHQGKKEKKLKKKEYRKKKSQLRREKAGISSDKADSKRVVEVEQKEDSEREICNKDKDEAEERKSSEERERRSKDKRKEAERRFQLMRPSEERSSQCHHGIYLGKKRKEGKKSRNHHRKGMDGKAK